MRSRVVSLFLLLAAAWPRPAAAQAVRVVVLAKQTLEGNAAADSGLDSAASGALARAGVRLVDLDAALRAQRFALSDAVQSGRVPNELSVLNADALASLQLRCAHSADKIMGSKIEAQHCVLDSKVVATSSGDVVFAESEAFSGHGLNAQMAVQSVLSTQLPAAIERAAQLWLRRFTQIDAWELDLTVSHVLDRDSARSLSERLRRLPGVNAARMAVYDRGLARYTLAGRGQAALDRLADEIEADPQLALQVSYEAPHVLHAEFDVAKALRRAVMVMAIAAPASRGRSLVPELLRASLMNLPYLEMAHTQPLLATPAEARAFETRLRAKAQELHVPLVLCGGLSENAGGFAASLKLLESASGRTLVASAGEAAASAQAFDAAVRSLDAQFRAAVGHPEVRQRLGMQKLGGSLVRDTRLVIHAFKLPALDAPAAPQQAGTLLVRNASQEAVNDARLTLSAGELEFAAQPLPEVAPGETLQFAVPLEQALRMRETYLPLTAAVTYKVGAVYERVSAVAPLIRPAANPDAEEPGNGAPAGYMALIREGVQRHAAGDWERARVAFLRAHQLFPNARTWRALGMVEFDLGHYREAFESLSRALETDVRPLAPEQRGEVRRLMVRARVAADPNAAGSIVL